MLGTAKAIYLATRKKNDQLYNTYFMRPIAAAVVAVVAKTPLTPNQITILSLLLCIAAGATLVALPTYLGGVLGIFVLQVSYLFDCVDGMLARHKKIASKEGHLFDFFTDELKASLLTAALALRLYRTGGIGLTLKAWPAESPWFLVAGVFGVLVIASAISLTNFVRRPEISGRETSVEAYYETVSKDASHSIVGFVFAQVKAFLRFLNHYPSHIWAFALAGRLEAFYWIYVGINLLYLGQGWLGLLLRLGRSRPS